MLRVESNHDIGFTEFEEEIIFDDDDPDFPHDVVPLMFRGEGSCNTNFFQMISVCDLLLAFFCALETLYTGDHYAKNS